MQNPGSPDAPVLNEIIAIEGGSLFLHWNSIENASYYKLDECFCPDFSGDIQTFQTKSTEFIPS